MVFNNIMLRNQWGQRMLRGANPVIFDNVTWNSPFFRDFDEEGIRLNRHFNQILERKGAKIEYGLRKEFGRLMAATGAYAIEDLDNIRDDMEE